MFLVRLRSTFKKEEFSFHIARMQLLTHLRIKQVVRHTIECNASYATRVWWLIRVPPWWTSLQEVQTLSTPKSTWLSPKINASNWYYLVASCPITIVGLYFRRRTRRLVWIPKFLLLAKWVVPFQPSAWLGPLKVSNLIILNICQAEYDHPWVLESLQLHSWRPLMKRSCLARGLDRS